MDVHSYVPTHCVYHLFTSVTVYLTVWTEEMKQAVYFLKVVKTGGMLATVTLIYMTFVGHTFLTSMYMTYLGWTNIYMYLRTFKTHHSD